MKMRADSYNEVAIAASIEMAQLMRLQTLVLNSPGSELDDLLHGFRGLAIRAEALADIVIAALAPDDAPKDPLADLAQQLYGYHYSEAGSAA